MLKAEYCRYNLIFKQPAVTSRAVMHDKLTYFIRVFDDCHPERFGLGECAIFEGLSCDDVPDYEARLAEVCREIAAVKPCQLADYPSIRFGVETALSDLANGGVCMPFPSAWTDGREKIPINGLVWMGTAEEMSRRVDDKIAAGFRCIKLKIGAIDWKSEVDMIEAIRSRYDSTQVEIRVDANGAFTMDNALPRLKRLADLQVHSIEQPIKAGQPSLMQFLCQVSPLPIALDEELIGRFTVEEKAATLDAIHPQYIVIKPTLTGGFSGAQEWIDLARERNIGWWITSSLESNIGLNALAQWVASLNTTMPQGLGTGALFTNNLDAPIYLDGDRLTYNPGLTLNRAQIDALDWRE